MKGEKKQRPSAFAPTPSCARCGKTLPTDERNVPVTSVWYNGKWFCPDCKAVKREDERNG